MVLNVHEREIAADAEVLGRALDALGRPGDRLWPSPQWWPMELDRPVAVGASGGHGPVRYRVVAHEPGGRVRFEVRPTLGLHGYHEFTVEPRGAGRCAVRHEVVGRMTGTMRVLWPLAVRPLHDAVLEDLLDNAERLGTGRVATPARWSRWVRMMRRRTELPKPRKVDVPTGATLARAAFDRVDLQDAWRVRLLPGMPTDPAVWAEAAVRTPPRWVGALLRLRNALVGLVGIEPGDPSSFDTLGRDEHELLLGTDDRHLDFRGSVLVDERWVTLSTVVRINNRRGRLYMAVVWPIHALVVRSMLHRAQHALALSAAANTATAGSADAA